MNLRKKIIPGSVIIIMISLGIIVYLSQLHLDFSQKYRSINGYQNIVFKDSYSNQCFQLCAWGLVKTKDVVGFKDHYHFDRTSYEYQLLVTKANAEYVSQVVPSPNGKYILYATSIYRGTGLTDDEDVYYKVYSIEDDSSTTVFSGFKQFLSVDWR